MWQEIASGWIPQEEAVTKDQYYELKNSPPSAFRGLVGYGQSFGGKWFGGYVDITWDSHWNRFTKSSYKAARKSVLELSDVFNKAIIRCIDYRKHDINNNMIIYCDPPYDGVQQYDSVGKFNSQEFWETMEQWSKKGAMIVVSEMNAPKNWKILSTKLRKHMLQVSKDFENDVRQENLYIFGEEI